MTSATDSKQAWEQYIRANMKRIPPLTQYKLSLAYAQPLMISFGNRTYNVHIL